LVVGLQNTAHASGASSAAVLPEDALDAVDALDGSASALEPANIIAGPSIATPARIHVFHLLVVPAIVATSLSAWSTPLHTEDSTLFINHRSITLIGDVRCH